MAADYTNPWAGAAGFPDDRRRSPDERLFGGRAYVNAAHRRGRPAASRVATRGRAVRLTITARAAAAPRRSQNTTVPLVLNLPGRNSK
jgi:hypothetical protein